MLGHLACTEEIIITYVTAKFVPITIRKGASPVFKHQTLWIGRLLSLVLSCEVRLKLSSLLGIVALVHIENEFAWIDSFHKSF